MKDKTERRTEDEKDVAISIQTRYRDKTILYTGIQKKERSTTESAVLQLKDKVGKNLDYYLDLKRMGDDWGYAGCCHGQ